jgi:hypothetical protein
MGILRPVVQPAADLLVLGVADLLSRTSIAQGATPETSSNEWRSTRRTRRSSLIATGSG